MSEARYNVVYRGNLLPGVDISAVKSKLMATFPLSEKQVESILKGKRVVLKKNADEATAKRLGMALKKAGMDIVLTKRPAEATTENPKPLPPKPSEEKPAEPKPAADKQGGSGEGMPADTPPKEPEGGWQSSEIPFEFTGSGKAYFKIWIVNILLSIVTLGIYSAWAKVRRKQYLYGNTRLKGAAFEYLANPIKILKGRLLVIGFFLLSSAVSYVLPAINIVFTMVFIVALPWVIVRSLMFNARNSAIRSIRFGFKGRVKDAALVYLWWPFVAIFTLGIIFPYVYYRQKKFIVENSTYGTTRFVFTATSGEYYRLFMSAIIPLLVGILAIVAAGFWYAPLSGLVVLALYLYMFAFYSVKTTNLLYNTSSIAHNTFRADLKIVPYLMLVLTNSLATAITLGIFTPWAVIRTLRYRLDHLTLLADADPETFVAAEEEQVSALGEEVGDFFDMDIGL